MRNATPEKHKPRMRNTKRRTFLFIPLAAILAAAAIAAFERPENDVSAEVPRGLFAEVYDTGSELMNVSAYSSEGAFETVVEGANRPVVSPDGELLIFTRENGSIAAVDSDSLEKEWETEIRPFSKPGYSDEPIWASAAATEEKIYVATQSSAELPISILALDRDDGAQTRGWPVNTEGASVTGARLFAPPGGESLHLVTGQSLRPTDTALHVRFGLPGGDVERRSEFSNWLRPEYSPSTLMEELRPTADGRSLYHLSSEHSAQTPPVLRFFDLEKGEPAPPVKLPFEESYPVYKAVSRDGGELYVLSAKERAVAVIDLESRRLEKNVSLDHGDSDGSSADRILDAFASLLSRPAHAKQPPGDMPLSPDGKLLYAIAEGSDGVWAIDTETWEISYEISPDTYVESVRLMDGELYVSTADATGSALLVVDANSGETVRRERTPYPALFTLEELYRDTYGRSPQRR